MQWSMLWRALFSYGALLLIARLLGKKQISHLTFFDYVVGLTIGNIAGGLSIDRNQDLVAGIQGLAVWTLIPLAMDWLSKQSYFARRLFNGRPTVIIQQGKVLQNNLHREHMTVSDMMQLLREENVFNLAHVEFAVLETNGKISVMRKTEDQPLTARLHGDFVVNEREPRLVVIDGNVMGKTLHECGYTREWLLGEILKQGANRFEDVFLAQVDEKGSVYVDLYNDTIEHATVKSRPLVYSTLKKAQADLESFALQTDEAPAKALYTKNAERLQALVDRIGPYMKD